MDELQTKKALRAAIKAGDVEALTQLINEDKSRLHLELMFGTCLHEAAGKGNLAIVKRLVELGADIERRAGIANATPLHDAAGKGAVRAA